MKSIAGKEIIRTLVPIHILDLSHPLVEFFWRLYNHPANNIFMYWSTRSFEEFKIIFKDIICKGSKEVFVYHEDGRPVGTCRIIQGEGPHKHIITCASTTIDPEKKRGGIGTRLKQTVREHVAKNYPEIKRHELTYAGDNPASRKLNNNLNYYEKCGYLTEGRYDDWWTQLEPNYNNMSHNPYQKWLEDNRGDHRLDEHFWPTSEIYAGSFEAVENYEKTAIFPSKTLRLFSFSQTDTDSRYSFRLAEEKDIPQLISIYKNSYTAWDNAYIEEANLKTLLKQTVENKQLFVVNDADKNIVAAIKTSKHRLIEYTVIFENAVIAKHINDSIVLKILFSSIIKHFLTNNPAIKRIELNVVAKDDLLIRGIENSGFEYCGTERGKYFDNKSQKYFDEHMFECKLFRLEDALCCCQKRIAAEAKLITLKGGTPFNIALSVKFLKGIEKLLKELLGKQNANQLSFEQENIIYRTVRTLCTQDYLSALERRDYIRNVKRTFSGLITKEPLIEKLYQECEGLLSMKLENQISIYSNIHFLNPNIPPMQEPANVISSNTSTINYFGLGM